MADRRDIATQARASLALEGLEADEETKALMNRWAAGEVTNDELRLAVDADIARLRAVAEPATHAVSRGG